MSRYASYCRWTGSVATIVICVIRVSFVAAFATHPSFAPKRRLQIIITRDTLVPWRQRNDAIWKLAMDNDETDEMDSHWIGDEFLTEADEITEPNDGGTMRPEEFNRQRDPMWYERSKKWVLIVDDEEPIRQAVGQYLFDSGYQVTGGDHS